MNMLTLRTTPEIRYREDGAGPALLLFNGATFCAVGYSERSPGGFQAIADLLWGRRPKGKAKWDAWVSPSASYWGRTDKPVLLIYGREDKNGTPENAKDLHRALLQSELKFIDQAGHFVVRETPEAVSELIDNSVGNLST